MNRHERKDIDLVVATIQDEWALHLQGVGAGRELFPVLREQFPGITDDQIVAALERCKRENADDIELYQLAAV